MNCEHAWQAQRFRDVDVLDERVRLMTAQNLAEEHARQNDVVGKLRLAGALRARVDLAKRFADYVEWLTRRWLRSASQSLSGFNFG